jgi:hypothetical protein
MAQRKPYATGDDSGGRGPGHRPRSTDASHADGRGRRARDRGGEPAIWFLTAALALLFAALIVGATFDGCGCKKRPEFDTGLTRSDRFGGESGGGGTGRGNGAGEGGGTGDGTGPGSGDGSGSGGEGSEGSGGSGGTGEGGQGGAGQGAGAAPGAASSGDSGSAPGGGSSADGKPLAGSGTGNAMGAGNDAAEPPAALPGRQRVPPQYDAATAAQVAERALRRAVDLTNKSDFSGAYESAVEAFQAVEPRAAADDACAKLLARSKELLAELAEKQKRKTPPRDVPTFFE